MPGQRVLAIALIVLGWTAVVAAKDIALVSNKSNGVTAVTIPDLVKICKGQANRWPDGKAVTFFTRSPASPDMKLVLEKI